MEQAHKQRHSSKKEYLLVATLFACLGAITWAIRGTAGWNGIDGTWLPGLTWGLLWWFVSWRNGLDARHIPLWLGLGLAFGGELGYGQYVSWIQGKFNRADQIELIEPWIGYLGFALCGIGWAAPGGIALGWILAGRKTLPVWLTRLMVPVGFAFLTRLLVQQFPQWFFPKWNNHIYTPVEPGTWDLPAVSQHQQLMLGIWLVAAVLCLLACFLSAKSCNHFFRRGIVWLLVGTVCCLMYLVSEWLFFPSTSKLGLFDGPLDKHLGRTVYTNTQNVLFVGWWIGALIVALWQRDKYTLVAGTVIGLGFGIGFPISAIWCHGYTYAPKLIDWWKMWELHSGFNLGLLYVMVLYWWIGEQTQQSISTHSEAVNRYRYWCGMIATSIGVGLAIYIGSRQNFLITGLILALLYLTGQISSTRYTDQTMNRQRAFEFVYAIFFLVFMLVWGVTSTAGLAAGLYDEQAADQYAWPTGRIWLMIPLGLIIVSLGLRDMIRAIRHPEMTLPPLKDTPLVTSRLVELMALILLIGTVSIWPAKIGMFYALFLMMALFALHRLPNR